MIMFGGFYPYLKKSKKSKKSKRSKSKRSKVRAQGKKIRTRKIRSKSK
tara:strand:- start:3473 stop:3616 length:144 start_codon:yes stop_codon:yes gene_type:complete